jgi:hypothetical protein
MKNKLFPFAKGLAFRRVLIDLHLVGVWAVQDGFLVSAALDVVECEWWTGNRSKVGLKCKVCRTNIA